MEYLIFTFIMIILTVMVDRNAHIVKRELNKSVKDLGITRAFEMTDLIDQMTHGYQWFQLALFVLGMAWHIGLEYVPDNSGFLLLKIGLFCLMHGLFYMLGFNIIFNKSVLKKPIFYLRDKGIDGFFKKRLGTAMSYILGFVILGGVMYVYGVYFGG